MARKQARKSQGGVREPGGELELVEVDEPEAAESDTDDDEVADSELGKAAEPETLQSPLPVDEDVQQVERIGERSFDDEDDFADGRSSSGVTTRADVDDWGRGTEPEDRPFEESDVPEREKPEEREG